VSTHTPTHAYTQTHSPIHTSLVSVHTHQHAPTCHEPDVCAYRSIPIHAYTHSLPLSHTHTREKVSCTAWQRATPSSCMMQQHTHEQDKTHTSPSRMHRAGYRHAASASVYTHSLIGMPQHACTIHICIHQKKAHTRTHAQTHHTCIHTSVCIMYARE
jgi:hypothetical protein